MRLEHIRKKIPPKEVIYFGVVAAVSAYLALVTPHTSADFNSFRADVVTKNAGSLGPAKVHDLLETAARSPDAGLSKLNENLAEAFKARFRPPRPFSEQRNIYLRGQENVFPMPPLALDYPGLPDVPGFDVPVGIAPVERFQARPALVDKRRVSLLDAGGENPLGFRDREDGR